MLPAKKTTITLKIPVHVFVEDDIFVAYAPALELSSYGKSLTDARKAFEEAAELFFDDVTEKGTLEKVLLGLGWQLQQKPKPVYNVPMESQSLSNRLQKKNPKKVYNERIRIPVTA